MVVAHFNQHSSKVSKNFFLGCTNLSSWPLQPLCACHGVLPTLIGARALVFLSFLERTPHHWMVKRTGTRRQNSDSQPRLVVLVVQPGARSLRQKMGQTFAHRKHTLSQNQTTRTP